MWAGTGTRDGETGDTDIGERAGPEVERAYMNTGEWGADIGDTGEQGAEVERVDIGGGAG